MQRLRGFPLQLRFATDDIFIVSDITKLFISSSKETMYYIAQKRHGVFCSWKPIFILSVHLVQLLPISFPPVSLENLPHDCGVFDGEGLATFQAESPRRETAEAPPLSGAEHPVYMSLTLGLRLLLRMLASTLVQANEMIEDKVEAKKCDVHPENEPGSREDTY
ncbi:hypothetical protein llap_6363 [Limosa lapponica baueri]|uniref:Uncharacterized protein n=1 Tax=Limosa lapponica baueri TaxID=1758121 RepID=A0A2I0UBG0_LIMLA|nr:hypothetical protein llap_6363 [Limosa lapponica baueri]